MEQEKEYKVSDTSLEANWLYSNPSGQRNVYKCSNCGLIVFDNVKDAAFCNCCGARMKSIVNEA